MDLDVLEPPKARLAEFRSAPRPTRRGTDWRALLARLLCEMASHETVMLAFAALFSLVAVIGSSRVTKWPEVLLRMAIATAAIAVMNFWSVKIGTRGRAGRWPRRLRLLYLFPLVPLFFKTAELISYPLHGHDFDYLFIAADKLLFGVDPTVWLFHHFPTWPALTEYLQICYSLFYFLPAALAFEFYLRRMRSRDALSEQLASKRLNEIVFVAVYGFLLSFACYFFLPAIGPRFTLHNFLDLSHDLPGLWLTEPLRQLLDRGENIVPGMTLAQILAHVTRDAFPSGHTDITLIAILTAFRFRARLRWAILTIGTSLIFATVYLRYHYVIDLFGGAVLAIVTLYTCQWVQEHARMPTRIRALALAYDEKHSQ